MGNCIIKQYKPDGKWTKERFVEKYSVAIFLDESYLKQIYVDMDKAAVWLNRELYLLKYHPTNEELVLLDDMLVCYLSKLIGSDTRWLEESRLYLEFQKDFRKVYNLPDFNW